MEGAHYKWLSERTNVKICFIWIKEDDRKYATRHKSKQLWILPTHMPCDDHYSLHVAPNFELSMFIVTH